MPHSSESHNLMRPRPRRRLARAALLLLLCAAPSAPAQTLAPGRPVERELAGGQSHTYQIALTAGQ